METVGKPPADVELHLLTDWSDPSRLNRTGRAAVLSVLVHIGLIVFIVVVPESIMQPVARRAIETVVTPLIEPLTVLTQKEPNTGKVDKLFNATRIEPRPRIQAPPAAPPAPPPQAAAPPTPKPPQQVALPEPPKIELNTETPKLTLPVGPPQIQAVERPHPGFEDVTPPRQVPPGQRVLPIPGPSVENAINGVLHSGGAAPVVTPAGPAASAELPQLLSDPLGVDFRPYLARVLASVKDCWRAIMPDAAIKQGRSGKVALQVRIRTDGGVGKVVFVGNTGVPALDNAAFAAISAASPFPRLPAAFKGAQIDVQFNFEYNKKKE
jgi:TonB family protein